ncbi:MAG: DUF2868 domain-containing protein [Azoarcus sp.]|nr:DUF2868 domain-containing protein [Azoarcus sp.]
MTLPHPPSVPLSALEARWLAELVRRHEARHGRLDDRAALIDARGGPPDLETRICLRAEALGTREGWRDAILRWRGRARLSLLAAGVLALMLGAGSAAAVLGDGTRPVNVVWALGGLLGVHFFSLLLWFASMLVSSRPARGGSALGALWLRLVALFDRSPAAVDLPLALGGLLARGRLATYGLGLVSHLLWLLALSGAAAGLLALFAARRYGFAWETTILPADVFVSLTTFLGVVPGWLGFPVPHAALVLDSVLDSGGGVGPNVGAAAAEAARRAWSGWLLGCLLVYGVLPRLLLALACALLWRLGTRRLRLDLGLPEYMRLRAALLPVSERLGISDPAPASGSRPVRHAGRPGSTGAVTMLALELGGDLPWPPAACSGLADDGGRLDSREQRRAILDRFECAPPARLLIAIDPRLTPDRGSLGLITELVDRAGETRLWALPAANTGADRLGLWRDGLARLGVSPDALLHDQATVARWLEATQ